MYRSFYGLKHKPFQISSDPKFLWLGEKHQEALAVLKYGILDNRGFLLLTGDVGTGKTTLINALVNSMGPDTIVAHVPDPGLGVMDFFNYIASAFHMAEGFVTKGEFLVEFRSFLEKAHTNQKQVLLIVDEAQRLSPELLEEIRLLSNIELQQTKLINIFFVGQDEFNDILSSKENRALRQRMTLNYHIDPLTEEETGKFVRFRLKVAGTEKKIFSAAAMDEIHAFSGGYPRLINIICDHALLTGYVSGLKTISAEVVAECAKELRLPKRQPEPVDTNPVSPQAAPRPEAAPVPTEAPAPGRSWRLPLLLILVLVLAAALFYPGGGDGVWNTLHGGIDRLAYLMTGKIPEPAPNRPTPPPAPSAASTSPAALEAAPPPAEPSPRVTPAPAVAPVVRPERTAMAEAPEPARAPEPPLPTETVLAQTPRIAEPEPGIETPASAPDPAPRVAPPPVRVAPVAMVTEIKSRLIVRFGYNSNDLSPEAYETLNQVADYLKGVPAATILIKGYTDAAGSYGYNLSLSRFRANIVKNYLVGNGVGVERMTALGLGSENPLAENDTLAGRNANRRVEIEIRKPDM